MASPQTPRRATRHVTLWDPLVRITHWAVAGIVLMNALITKGGSVPHVSLGWALMALLIVRLVWGGLGPREARFSAFPPNPVAAVRHLRDMLSGRVRDYPSHNPAGALMVYAFWALLALMVATGLVMTGGATPMQVAADKAAVESGDWSALIDKSAEDKSEAEGEDNSLRHTAEEVHEVVSNLLLLLAALHLAGVIVESRALRRNLVAPMVLGERRK